MKTTNHEPKASLEIYETENDLPKAARTELNALINQRSADAVDLHNQPLSWPFSSEISHNIVVALSARKHKSTRSNRQPSFGRFWRTATAEGDQLTSMSPITQRLGAHGGKPAESGAARRVLCRTWIASMWRCEIGVRRKDSPNQDLSTSVRILNER